MELEMLKDAAVKQMEASEQTEPASQTISRSSTPTDLQPLVGSDTDC